MRMTTHWFCTLSLLGLGLGLASPRQAQDDTFHMDMKHEGSSEPLCFIPDENSRFDCFPTFNEATQEKCEAMGCCWQVPSAEEALHRTKPEQRDVNDTSISVPYCFFPKNYNANGYEMTDLKETAQGYQATLSRTTKSGWPDDVMKLTLDVFLETDTRLHFKIYDSSKSRYEVPIETPKPPAQKANKTEYMVFFSEKPFGITVYRRSNGALIFSSAVDGAPLIFADQFIQMTTATNTGIVYGLGERKARLLHKPDWQSLVMWARDQGPQFNANLYGVHPFYMGLEDDGQAHGVFLLNSNAMEILLQPMPALTFRTIGGILDFYIFTGPHPDFVVEQYTDVIGKPTMPPYWALGFHLCRYGYGTSAELKKVIARNRALQIPYDTQWTDIDYMDKYRDWTYDNKSFVGLPDIVNDLHSYGQKYVIIVDPAISNEYPGNYAPYDEGVADDIFIKNATGQILIGAVWPGPTAFPDWTHPKVGDWWYRQAQSLHNTAPFDGLWIDMNEPSNFKDGSEHGCTNNTLDKPPYVPAVRGGDLADKTVCPSAKQYVSSHYNLHNMYGYGEGVATNYALTKLLNKRSIVISRSTFPGHGHYAGHWSGDISSTWEDLYYSIPVILNFQMYGIPLMGADICGFHDNADEQLCVRWMQLGAFYPFMRNHNDKGMKDQDPGAFSPQAQGIMKDALQMRYAMLPYLYTLFHHSHVRGGAVARPLFFNFPEDPVTYDIDEQFMWGQGLLISPALKENQTEVSAYFPKDRWYDMSLETPPKDSVGSWVNLPTPLDKINLHLRGGHILPIQSPAITTAVARKGTFGLIVALNSSGDAYGELFWDDGESLGTFEKGDYTGIMFTARNNELKSEVEHAGYKPETGMTLESVTIVGVTTKPTGVKVNGQDVKFVFDEAMQILLITELEASVASLLSPLTVQW